MMARDLALALAIVASIGCLGSLTPSDPIWGKQACAHCHMLLSDPHSAAQLLSREADALYFDDVGCLIEFLRERPTDIEQAWVRDPNGTWLRATDARYTGKQSTPMGYGFLVRPSGELDFRAVQTAIASAAALRRQP